VPTISAMNYSDLIKHYGSQSKVARAINLRSPSVWQWKKDGVPELRQLEFQKLTNGALRADRAVVKKYQALLGVAGKVAA
jgi:hypothetical protein